MYAVRHTVYGFELPFQPGWLSAFDALSFDVGTFLFPSWSCVGGLRTRITFNGLWPLLLMVSVTLVLLARATIRKGSVRGALLQSLRAAIVISFCVLPSVTRSLFLAFMCESYKVDDDAMVSKSYLTASLDVECNRGQHTSIVVIAGLFIVVWPVAMPLLYAVLLRHCRHSISKHQPSELSRAIRFLWSDCLRRHSNAGLGVHSLTRPPRLDVLLADKDSYFWYELVVLVQKLLLTNVLLFLNFGSGGSNKLLRLFAGCLIALLSLTLQFITHPFRKHTDDAFNCVAQMMLVLFFLIGIVIKLCDSEGPDAIYSLLDAKVENSCSTLVGIDSMWAASIIMICVGLAVVLVPFGMLLRQLTLSQAVPILRDASTMEPPILLLGPAERYHLFLCAASEPLHPSRV